MAAATPRERPRPPAGEATREALLTAATELFALHGFEGVSVEQIARKAGVNKALISYHFRGKRGLYRSILGETLSAALARLKELGRSERPADQVLREFMRGFHQMVTVQRPHFPALMLREMLTAATVRGGAFETEAVPEIVAVFAVMRGILERGVKEGVFRPVDPFLTHIGLMGSLIFFYATEPTRRRIVEQASVSLPLPSPEAFVEHMQEMVVRGLLQDIGPVTPGQERGERT
jgi:TetR/AcrR family transcriptional regulator